MLNRIFKTGLLVLLAGSLYAQDTYYDAPNLAKQMGSLTVIPFFVKGTDKCWFSADKDYYLVDAKRGTRQCISDKKYLGGLLQELLHQPVDTAAIKVEMPGSNDMGIYYKEARYSYSLVNGKLVPAIPHNYPHSGWRNGLSPDKKWQLVAKNHNLFLRKNSDSSMLKLSFDGELYHSFNMNDADTGTLRESNTEAVWIKGTSKFYVVRKDRRKVGTMTVVHSLSTPRPRVETYKYELPGDKDVTQYELYLGDASEGTFLPVNTGDWKDQELEVLYGGAKVYFLRKKRTRDEMDLCAVDWKGTVQVLIHEVSRPFINDDVFSAAILNDGKDILWWSDRSGWGHYYLYDGAGHLQGAVTAGDWTAGKLLRVDTTSKRLYFYGYGREQGINPNYSFVYAVNFDGKGLRLLTPENANHEVFMAPGNQFFVDNYSRIDMDPRTTIRSTSSNWQMEIWKPDLSRLYKYGWKRPEMFTIKAADGVTDIYGLMWKPFDFDSTKKYPIISQVYPGPQTETVWSSFTVLDRYNNTALAQTGSIVVCMGHRGGSPYRNKAYHTYGYGNLRDYALDDDRHGIIQLAARYHFIDTTRVGIFGHSGGGMMAVAAICTYPDFYKVAVASSGNHDNNIYNRTWGETFQGIDSGFAYHVALNQALASKLKGHLLLVTGEVDTNVHPAATYRMVNALIQAGKDFDMLVLPGQSHTYEDTYKAYFQQRLRQYFKFHL
ncbi:MAG: prolyl oligopeptidase family serine peptidase [Bacteroidetes bacterium]|nr:prolyl oligopeptidase family serine peptidase [Bacteroidota bacterium]